MEQQLARRRVPKVNGATTHAGSAFEHGNKIACDPRDDQDRESQLGANIPRLTLMEEVLLLGLKDKHVCPGNVVSYSSPCVVPELSNMSDKMARTPYSYGPYPLRS